MGFFDDTLHHLTKPAKTNSRRRHRMARAVAEVLEQRVLLSTFVVTSLADDGSPGTLRSEIALANANTSAPNTIDFQSGLAGTITLTQGVLEITAGTTTFNGPGANVLTVSGGNTTDGVFKFDGPSIAAISGLTITGGLAINSGGGGGVYNDGILSLTDCTVSGNVVGGALGQNGGGVSNSGQMTLTDCTISNNQDGVGGFSPGGGGGVANVGGTMTLTNCTVSGNTAEFGSGGGVFTIAGTLTINSSTISGNQVGPPDTSGGGIFAQSSSVILNNTIVAGNTKDSNPSDISDISGSVGGFNNLVGTGGSAGLVNGTNGNIVGVADPMLGPLGYNGGPTQTMPLLSGSPAIDAGSNSLIPGGITTDQRGFPRINNGTIDIGALESLSSSANGEFVTQLYTDILHRSPDMPGMTNWTTALNNGTDTYQQVALGFLNSLEYYDDTVTADYQQYLGRAPSAGELNNWVNQILAGTSTEAVRAGILSLPEFYNDSGGTPDGYITALYQNLFSRTPDMAGQTNWEGVLAGPGGAGAVANGMVFSLEFYNDNTNSFYESFLHRAGTTSEINNGAGELLAGASTLTIMSNIVTSPEYFALNSIS